MIFQIAGVIPDSHSVSLGAGTFYAHDYDSTLPRRLAALPSNSYRALVYRSLLFARLASQARGFVYVGPRGYLDFGSDERLWEITFLRQRGVKVALYWCGSDIRSTKLMHELEASTGLPNIFSYVGLVTPSREAPAYEVAVRKRAVISDDLADIVFDNPTDHKSYVTRHSEPFLYFMPDSRFEGTEGKFDYLDRIVVTHAATSPVIKGTQLVRAAVAKLRAEGYDFEFVEMTTAPNHEVLEQLRRTHIALNQFYGFTPAVFGTEALAARCAVLQSADGTIETTLAPGANEAWVVTKHFELYDNLKRLLDEPELIEPQANRGQSWAREFGSARSTGVILNSLLESVLNESYDRNSRVGLSNEASWRISA